MPTALDQLTDKQEAGIIALLREPTHEKAAAAIGVDEKTLRRWLKDPTFERAYREARRETFRQAISLTQRYAPVAVQALLKIVADQKVAPNARVSAAGLLLKFSRESIELDDLAARVEALEQTAAAPGPTYAPPAPLPPARAA
jgi:predicted site-specific integrase-resolvase